ncbi:MAG: twin-arginine translocase TatA/TatE family subunit [Flavobacteriaceae bacterium]|nr:twin-arginine translocase TatA/TatE family subunit [Flavobacteriaceae bacterium]
MTFNTFLFMGGYQTLIVLGVVILLFGGRKIPELMKGLGTGIKEFKSATKEDEKEDKKEEDKKIEDKK